MKSVNFYFKGLLCPVFTPFSADKWVLHLTFLRCFLDGIEIECCLIQENHQLRCHRQIRQLLEAKGNQRCFGQRNRERRYHSSCRWTQTPHRRMVESVPQIRIDLYRTNRWSTHRWSLWARWTRWEMWRFCCSRLTRLVLPSSGWRRFGRLHSWHHEILSNSSIVLLPHSTLHPRSL